MLTSSIARRLIAPLIATLAAATLLLAPTLARADTGSTLTVLGTSDVSDSGLIPNLIAGEFENAYPQFTFKYQGSATGTAIQNAESGTGGPSALIVHAASLENQFVAGGFSYNNQPGYAIFRNDFVLTGPSSQDPAGITSSGDTHNIAKAFADIATAGVAGHDTFISRGGTNTAPGTTVAEHQIWALVDSAGLIPGGVVLCDVSAADGGGETPISPAVQSTSGQPCPDSGTVSGPDAPGWYIVNSGVNQATNVEAGNSCTLGTSGANTCYVFTDRGTYDFLSVGAPAPGNTQQPSLIPNLTIVARDNDSSAPGGANALINYFHVYIINPNAAGETVNLTAAQDFVKFLTSPAVQAKLKNYLADTPDPGGPPFVADASPIITASGLPAVDPAGTPVTVSGTVTNAELGYPALASQTVALDEIEGGIPVPIKSTNTDSSGAYSITFTPTAKGVYQVSTGQITMVENDVLNPVYSDTLSPAASSTLAMNLQSSDTIGAAHGAFGGATVTGAVAPGAPDTGARVVILARPQGSSVAYQEVGGTSLAAGQSTYAVSVAVRPGNWLLRAQYTDPGQILQSTTAAANVTVPAGSRTVGFGQVTVAKGAVTVNGNLGAPAAVKGAKAELFAMRTGRLSGSGGSGPTHLVGTAAVPVGAKTFKINATLARGYNWVLQLEFIQPGQPTVWSRVRSLAVH
jgi:ABC-type tungstate transport system permease subunit